MDDLSSRLYLSSMKICSYWYWYLSSWFFDKTSYFLIKCYLSRECKVNGSIIVTSSGRAHNIILLVWRCMEEADPEYLVNINPWIIIQIQFISLNTFLFLSIFTEQMCRHDGEVLVLKWVLFINGQWLGQLHERNFYHCFFYDRMFRSTCAHLD